VGAPLIEVSLEVFPSFLGVEVEREFVVYPWGSSIFLDVEAEVGRGTVMIVKDMGQEVDF